MNDPLAGSDTYDILAGMTQKQGEGMTEKEQATRIAHDWLDFKMNSLVQMVPGDPDCDACVLARQFMRALDRIQYLESVAGAVSQGDGDFRDITRNLPRNEPKRDHG